MGTFPCRASGNKDGGRFTRSEISSPMRGRGTFPFSTRRLWEKWVPRLAFRKRQKICELKRTSAKNGAKEIKLLRKLPLKRLTLWCKSPIEAPSLARL